MQEQYAETGGTDDDIRSMKMVAHLPNHTMLITRAISPMSPMGSRKVADMNTELNKKKESPMAVKKLEPQEKSTDEDDSTLDVGEELKRLKAELALAKEELAHAKEMEKLTSTGDNNDLLKEVSRLKNELKLATEAEQNNGKALEDMALALKEVATDCGKVKEELIAAQTEVESLKAEGKKKKRKEEEYKFLLQEARKSSEQYKNMSERLRCDLEDSTLAWNDKEAGFVGCIKRAERERDDALEENDTLVQSLANAENQCKKSKEENNNLRDILKQALNEANAAKEAAEIAKAENSQLKDEIAEKEDALEFVTRENENLKANEALAFENIKELKKMIYESSSALPSGLPEGKPEAKRQHSRRLSNQFSFSKEQPPPQPPPQHKDAASLNLKELKISHKHGDDESSSSSVVTKVTTTESQNHEDSEDSPIDGDPLKGSIFDGSTSPDTPAGLSMHHRRKSSTFMEEDGFAPEDYEHIEGGETESDRNSRKKKALLRRFGDLMKRKSFHKKEPSMEC